MMWTNSLVSPTLCWDCAKATDEDACPWVKDNTPIPDWQAIDHRVAGRNGYNSFRITQCPLFYRDSYFGGKDWRWGRPPKVKLEDSDTIEIAASVIEQAVSDWKTLRSIGVEEFRITGQYIKQKELIAFFNSRWFEQLLAIVTEVEPSKVRVALGVQTLEQKGGVK